MDDRARAVALIAHPDASDGRAGAVLLLTVQALEADGWHVVVALPTAGALAERLIALGVQVETVPAPVLRRGDLGLRGFSRFARSAISAASSIRAALRRVAPDVVLVSTMTQPEWTLAARLRRIPVLVHVQELTTAAPTLVREAIARPITAADRVVADSDATRTALLEVVPSLSSKTSVLPTGVAGPTTVLPPREALAGSLRICCVARIEPGSGVRTVVDALALLVRDDLLVQLEIAALTIEPNAMAGLRTRLAQLDLEDLVTVRPTTGPLWDVLAESDIVVIPSRAETSFGSIAVEALLSGRPVVLSTSKGMAESTSGFASAIPVDEGEPAQIAVAVDRIVASWSAFGRSALTLAPVAAQRFSPDGYRTAIAAEVRALLLHHDRQQRLLAA